MSENIRVSEVSDILRKQLEGINTNVQLDEIGTVLQVSDGVVRIYGLRNAEANELLEFDNGIKAIVMNLEEDNVGVGTQSAGSYLPSAGKPTVTDGLESCRRYDSYRTRTA